MKTFKALLFVVLLFLFVGCGSSTPSETIKENETKPAATAETEKDEKPTHPTGSFILTGGVGENGENLEESIALLAASDTYSILEIDEKGKGSFDFFGESYDISCDSESISVNGNKFDYTYDGTTLMFNMDESKLIFTDKTKLSTDTPSQNNTDSSPTNGSLSLEDLDITEYKYENGIGDTLYYLVIKNNSQVAAELYANVTAYDAENKMIGAANGSIDVIGPNEESIMVLYFDSVTGIDHIDYTLQYNTDIYYDPVISGLKVEEVLNGNVLVLSVINELDYPAEFVEAYALFFDANDNIVYVTENYITDNDSEIKPGATLTAQLESYDPFDHVKWVLTGRHSKY